MLVLSFVMAFVSCNQTQQPMNADNQSGGTLLNRSNVADYYIPTVDELTAFEDATLEDEPEYHYDMEGMDGMYGMDDRDGMGNREGMGNRGGMGNRDGMGGMRGHKDCDRNDNDRDKDKNCDRRHEGNRHGMFLGKIIRELDLTDRQMEAVKGFIGDFRDCMRRVMESTKEARYEIIQRARAERLKIIRAFRAGDINRERAIAQLRELNQNMREALRNEIDWELRCNCITNLIDNIQEILTEEQLVIWQRFIDNLDGPCFVRDGGNG